MMPVRLFQWCDRSLRLAFKVITVLHQGIWLGLLRHRHLDQLTEAYYDQATKYSDPTYNVSGLRDWEQRLIAEHFEPGSCILVAAAGGGREIVGLARAGYRVDGFDCNEGCVSHGRQLLADLGLPSRLALAPPNALPDDLATYDGVIIGWGGYMHIVGRSRRIALLKQLAMHMPDGAPLLVSFFQQQHRSSSQAWAARIANVIRTCRLAERVEPGDWLDGSFDHHFTEAELRAEFADAGYRVDRYLSPGYGFAIAHVARQPSVTSTDVAVAEKFAWDAGRRELVGTGQDARHG